MSYSIKSIDSINLQNMQSNGLNKDYPIKKSQETNLKKDLSIDFERLIQQIQFTSAFQSLFDQNSPEFHLSFSINKNLLEISNRDTGDKIVVFIEIDPTATGSYKIISDIFQKATTSLQTSEEAPKPLPSPRPFVAPSALSIEIEESPLPKPSQSLPQPFSRSSILAKPADLPPSFGTTPPSVFSSHRTPTKATQSSVEATQFMSAFGMPTSSRAIAPSPSPSSSSNSSIAASIPPHRIAAPHASLQPQPSTVSPFSPKISDSGPSLSSTHAVSSSSLPTSKRIQSGNVQRKASALQFMNAFHIKPQTTNPPTSRTPSKDLDPLPRKTSIHRSTHRKHFTPFQPNKAK